MTDKGEVTLALEVDVAPGSSVAFDSLVTAGCYNGRPSTDKCRGSWCRAVPARRRLRQHGLDPAHGGGVAGLQHRCRGLASAGPDTESCQFFIMLGPAPHLDGRYTRFAHVVDGWTWCSAFRWAM